MPPKAKKPPSMQAATSSSPDLNAPTTPTNTSVSIVDMRQVLKTLLANYRKPTIGCLLTVVSLLLYLVATAVAEKVKS